ncbi:SAM-dependent methyltransferase [Natronosporangium hydrolyticum]|uniref:SAM-dependent methyltransferase n=1 Tax=Natronosporangium hydrolyticum TaxID=2811111 RepID=A0A895YCI8_9ACTN|nr:SAM-dependent methyltransferase [Natronosporangium hydrolyticum]QSB13049.1 SAM-dependent methyltransferase [Natronosporangium hydrolyticum]
MTHTSIPERPTSAGMYDYYLGGAAHTPIDRAAAEQIVQLIPAVQDGAWANRGFLQRAVRRLASEYGIRQFLDLGSGLPTQRNTHDVVAESVPDGRVVYVDVDPAVVAQAADLLDGVPTATAVQADVRDPAAILDHPETRRLIDFSQPVGVLLVAVLHFVDDDDDPWGLVARYLAAVPAGSYLALSHSAVGDRLSDQVRDLSEQVYRNTAHPPTDRSKTEIEQFFRGLALVPPHPGAPPAVTFVGLWGAEDLPAADSDGARMGYAGVARKP